MELITERLTLRDFVESDWEASFAYENDPLYLRYYEWTERSPENVKMFIGWFLDQQQTNPRFKFHLAITLKETGQLIGQCGVRKDSADERQANIGYELSPKHWGQGYATEAVRTMVEYGFKTMGVHRIWAQCVADNKGSIHVLEKMGMKLEGHLRETQYYKGRYWDELIFGILESEWRGL